MGSHNDAVSTLSIHSRTGSVISGSWDKTLRLHDLRGGQSCVYDLPGKVFSTDVCGDIIVAGLEKRAIHVYDVRNMAEPIQRRESSLKYMTRAVKCMPDGSG